MVGEICVGGGCHTGYIAEDPIQANLLGNTEIAGGRELCTR